MKCNRVMATSVLVMLCACGEQGIGKEASADAASARKGPHAQAVTRQFSIEMDKLIVAESTYVDGVAMRLKDGGAGVMLTEAPLSACARFSAGMRGDLDFDAATYGDKPVLLAVRNDEHPEGAILLLEPYSTTTLEDKVPVLVTEGDRLVAKGDVGDAGWGSIDATRYGAKNAAHVSLDVDLPYLAVADADPVAADASAEAAWLRELRGKAVDDPQAVVDDTLMVGESDYSASTGWFDILANWKALSVVALATDTDCATLVMRSPGFAGGYSEAVVMTRIVDGKRKVTGVQSNNLESVEGSYVLGRIEHSGLGAFPVVHARAAREEGVGLVVYFSDKPIGADTFETLVTRQRMLRAVSSAEWSGQYSFSEYELGGPGVAVEKFSAGNSTSNPHVDDKEIGGLIKLEEGAGPLITVNFRLPLGN